MNEMLPAPSLDENSDQLKRFNVAAEGKPLLVN